MDNNTSLNVQRSITDTEDALALLEKIQGIIRIEKILTDTIEKVQPWLSTVTKCNNNDTGTSTNSNRTNNKQNPNKVRVRPIPRTMEEVTAVLAVSRTLSSRTSAPAGWNPLAPVVGFSTPAPLPNQLRSGALAELQLNRARQDNKKRQKLMQQQEQEQVQIQQQQRQQVDEKKQQQKKQQESIIQKQQQSTNSNSTQRQQQQQQPNRPITAPNRPKLDVSMNLSDDDDDSSDEDSDSS